MMKILFPSPESQTHGRMFFSERAFGLFFLLWGLVLVLGKDTITPIREGMFLAYLEEYMSGRCWGTLLLIIGILRWVAFRYQSIRWRLNLSLISFVVVAVVAAISVYTRLWSATAPLALFVTYVAFWCHKSLVRDLR